MNNKNVFIVLSSIALILLGYTNCSDEVSFETAGDTSSNVAAADLPIAESTDDGIVDVIDENENKEILDRIPEEELENPRPIIDLEKDPELWEIYKCGDGKGVVICHFPNNVEAQSTSCVGHNAVSSHYDHERSYESNGNEYFIQDYLGPCRIQLK